MDDPVGNAITLLQQQTMSKQTPVPAAPTDSVSSAIDMLQGDLSGKAKIQPPAPSMGPATEAGSWTLPRTVNLNTNAANRAIAAGLDMLPNTPTNLWNIVKSVPSMLRGEPLPPQTPTPDLANRAITKMGFINPNMNPETTGERMMTAGTSGLVAGAMAPASSVGNMASNMVSTGVSSMIGQGTTEATGNPTLGMAAGMAAVPAASAGMNATRNAAAQSMENARVRAAQMAQRDQTLADARKEGYVVPLSSVNPSFVNKRLEGISGKAAVGQEASYRNQQVTNDIAREELGLPKDTALTEGALTTFRTKAAAPYREVAAIDPEASAALDKLKQTRADMNVYYRHYDMSGDPKSLATAKQASAEADHLETYIEGIAKNAGKPDLVTELRDARTQIAKSYDIERALNVGSGDVSARILGKALDRGKPLSGKLAVAARFAEAFSPYAQEGPKIPTPGVSKMEVMSSIALGLGGFGAMGPAGAAAAAIPFVSGPARSLVLSPFYQRTLGAPNYGGGFTPRLLSNTPATTDPILRMLMQGALASPQAPTQ